MRLFLAALVMFTGASITGACGGDDDTPGEDMTAIATGQRPASPGGPAPTQAPPDDDEGRAEISAIVGAVNAATGAIEINQVQGPEVTHVEVTERTSITSARGNLQLALDDLHPSDRIVARGAIEDGALVADEVVVQPVVPGAQPGG